MGAIAGTVDLIQRCFTGIETRGDNLWMHSSLLAGLKSLTLNIHYQQHVLGRHMTPTCARTSTETVNEQPIQVNIKTVFYPLKPGEVREFLF